MAQSMHKRLRNRFRSRRYAHPLDLDEDITEALLMWKYGESDYPTFYNGDSNIISEEGEVSEILSLLSPVSQCCFVILVMMFVLTQHPLSPPLYTHTL